MKVEVRSEKNKQGYDVLILSEDATVADYLAAINLFIEESGIARPRHEKAQAGTCMACNVCCQERIPLTSIDVVKLSSVIPLEELFAKYIYIYVHGRAVDITLQLGPDGICRLNSPDSRLCCQYQVRPLVCQTYICCPSSRRAARLREVVVNTGEDQLVRDWLKMVRQGIIEPKIDEAIDLDLHEDDWLPTPFEGKRSYDEVFLKDLCTPQLWEKLKWVR
ncbi:hypothetical protein Tfer_3198 [Thermincola ferriacetica]|uniref:Flagellin N-methylase n=1 Tax=Thermincola ferriacetica TaxID=281456 RepID=A0A0L6VY62_9FIRM|nr:YkgJ family cysteine cluster protein [Thermincola ferriacetica]KNZ68272.1 hypothetical protein Tfer_3198 [Thermincola ferriacetica]